jgi:hypothetical protein
VVVGGEPKTLLCRVWPQHADDDVAREVSHKRLTRHSLREGIGARRPAEGTAGDGLHRPSADEAEGAETQGGPGVSVTPRLSIRSDEFVETHDVPLPGAPTVGVLYHRQ